MLGCSHVSRLAELVLSITPACLCQPPGSHGCKPQPDKLSWSHAGHSLGGLLVQRYLLDASLRDWPTLCAAVLLASATPDGNMGGFKHLGSDSRGCALSARWCSAQPCCGAELSGDINGHTSIALQLSPAAGLQHHPCVKLTAAQSRLLRCRRHEASNVAQPPALADAHVDVHARPEVPGQLPAHVVQRRHSPRPDAAVRAHTLQGPSTTPVMLRRTLAAL